MRRALDERGGGRWGKEMGRNMERGGKGKERQDCEGRRGERGGSGGGVGEQEKRGRVGREEEQTVFLDVYGFDSRQSPRVGCRFPLGYKEQTGSNNHHKYLNISFLLPAV